MSYLGRHLFPSSLGSLRVYSLGPGSGLITHIIAGHPWLQVSQRRNIPAKAFDVVFEARRLKAPQIFKCLLECTMGEEEEEKKKVPNMLCLKDSEVSSRIQIGLSFRNIHLLLASGRIRSPPAHGLGSYNISMCSFPRKRQQDHFLVL